MLTTDHNPGPVQPNKLLIVDDDPNFLFGISRTLTKAQFRVITATDGFSGIAKAQVERPDLILLDVNMPKMNGFEVKKVLEKNPITQSIPVVFLTALSDRLNTLNGLALAEDYINKPIEADILTARIKTVLRRLRLGYNLAVQDAQFPRFSLDNLHQWAQAVEMHDYGTSGHTQRVTAWFVALARAIGITGEDLENAAKGAMLHDIGKLAIPEHILNKPGPLTDDEWEIMRQHPQFGYQMLESMDFLRPALDIPHYHHERWDGSGYPNRLQGEAIPLVVRIFSVVDVFDALTSKRPYKNGFSDYEALEIIWAQRGKQFDPQVVDFFLVNINLLIKEVNHGSAKDSLGH